MDRNQFFMAGLIVLFLGLQLRYVDSYVLTDDCTKFLAKRFAKKTKIGKTASQFPSLFNTTRAPEVTMRKTVQPPNWLGWALLSAGAVMILQSFAMPRPSG